MPESSKRQSSNPSTPPATERSRLSIRVDEAIDLLAAPIASRTAISFRASHRSRDQQVGHVEASNQQHQAHHAHEYDESGSELLAHAGITRGGRLDANFAIQEPGRDCMRMCSACPRASIRVRGST